MTEPIKTHANCGWKVDIRDKHNLALPSPRVACAVPVPASVLAFTWPIFAKQDATDCPCWKAKS